MRILVFGAGVIGSVYAAELHRAGHEVVVLAAGADWMPFDEMAFC